MGNHDEAKNKTRLVKLEFNSNKSNSGSKRLISKHRRMEVQRKHLVGIHRGLSQCSTFPVGKKGDDKVVVEFGSDGSYGIYNTNKCSSPECSICGAYVRKKDSEILEMALQWVDLQGGELLFLTGTQQTSRNKQSIIAACKAMEQMVKNIGTYNKRKGTDFKIYATIETKFSRVSAHRDLETQMDVQEKRFHPHMHALLTVPKDSLHAMADIKMLLRKWWIQRIEKEGGKVRYRNSGKLMAPNHVFQIDHVDAGAAISRYITKHVLAMEMTYDATKDNASAGRSLEELKADIYLHNDPEDIWLFKTYFNTMHGRTRHPKTRNFFSYAEKWKEHIDRHTAFRARNRAYQEFCENYGVSSDPEHYLYDKFVNYSPIPHKLPSIFPTAQDRYPIYIVSPSSLLDSDFTQHPDYHPYIQMVEAKKQVIEFHQLARHHLKEDPPNYLQRDVPDVTENIEEVVSESDEEVWEKFLAPNGPVVQRLEMAGGLYVVLLRNGVLHDMLEKVAYFYAQKPGYEALEPGVRQFETLCKAVKSSWKKVRVEKMRKGIKTEKVYEVYNEEKILADIKMLSAKLLQ